MTVTGGAATDLGRWEPLHPEEPLALFHELSAPWWLAGGWALDLFVGRQTREHADLDIETLRRDQIAVQRHLDGWDLHTAHAGVLRPWRTGEELGAAVNSIWCRPAATSPWMVQVMFAESEGDRWRYRRYPTLSRPLATLGLRTDSGIPFLAPEVQLLYKARAPRPKDDADFALILPLLAEDRRVWLAEALATAHPGHRWLPALKFAAPTAPMEG